MRASALLAVGLLVQAWVDRTMIPADVAEDGPVPAAVEERSTQGIEPIGLREVAADGPVTGLQPRATIGTADNRPDKAPSSTGRVVSAIGRPDAGPAPAHVPDARGSRRELQAKPTPILAVAEAGALPRRTPSSTARPPRLSFADALALPDVTATATSHRLDRAARPAHHDMVTIRQVIQEYATAFGRLDPGAAKRVWPSLDEEALARAFRGLRAQSLTFDDCGVTLLGEVAAQANCHGRATYLPKVGRHRPLSTSGEWTFSLERTGSAWVIQSAAVQ